MSGGNSSLDALAPLGERLRRTLFTLVRHAHRPVSREEAAAEVGISRKLAAFHLDKLVEAGLLRARFGSAPRKVGRAPKLYEPAGREIRVLIPPREHGLLAEILVQAVGAEGGETALQAALRIARAKGGDAGAAARGPNRVLRALRRHGFEPYPEGDAIRLRNCPFHPLARQAPDLVCAINHAYVTGLVAGIGTAAVRAHLEPRPGHCCVELRPALPA